MKKQSKLTYFMAIYKDSNHGYWTTFADFDCLVDQGETIEEAIENATKFLNNEVDYRVNKNELLPIPANAEDFVKKLDPADGNALCIVPIVVYPPAKTERINITAKGDMIAKIDSYIATHKELNRSKLLINATLEYISNNP